MRAHAPELRGDGWQFDEASGERVGEADGIAGHVAEDEEALSVGFDTVAGELREVDVGAAASGEVEKAPPRAVAVGEHDPPARAEATFKGAAARVGGALPPRFARGPEPEVLGYVVPEQPVCDLLGEVRRQVGPISPAT